MAAEFERLLILAGVIDGHAHRFPVFCWATPAGVPIEACASRRSITLPWFARVRSNWRPMCGALGVTGSRLWFGQRCQSVNWGAATLNDLVL